MMWALCTELWRAVARAPSFPGSPGEGEGDCTQWEMNTVSPFSASCQALLLPTFDVQAHV